MFRSSLKVPKKQDEEKLGKMKGIAFSKGLEGIKREQRQNCDMIGREVVKGVTNYYRREMLGGSC